MNQRIEALANGRIQALNGRVRFIIFSLILITLGILLYGETLYGLLLAVILRKESSHSVIVPFISGYFLWLKREKIRRSKAEFALLPGISIIAVGLLVLYFSPDTSHPFLPGFAFLSAFSFFVVAAGLIIIFFGLEIFKELRFPLAFLLTMIPLPPELWLKFANWMKAITTYGSVWLLNVIHFPIYREGYRIQLPGLYLFVDPGCSGIRYLLSFFVFSIAYAYLFKGNNRSRLLVVLAAFPISFIASVLRLSVIFLAAYYIGPITLRSTPHLLLSWGVFAVVLVAAVALDQYLSGIRGRGSGIRHRA